MASIYKRTRIRMPKIMQQTFEKGKKKQTKKILKFTIIVVVMLFTIQAIFRAITPILNRLCEEKAKSIATIICNEESTKIIQNYQYEDLITIHRDEEEQIRMIQSNIVPINYIISDVGEKVQERMDEIR